MGVEEKQKVSRDLKLHEHAAKHVLTAIASEMSVHVTRLMRRTVDKSLRPCVEQSISIVRPSILCCGESHGVPCSLCNHPQRVKLSPTVSPRQRVGVIFCWEGLEKVSYRALKISEFSEINEIV